MLASIVDSLHVANWMYGSVHRGENTQPPPRPEPLRRPGDPEKEAEQPEDKKPAHDFGTAEEQAQKLAGMLSGMNMGG